MRRRKDAAGATQSIAAITFPTKDDEAFDGIDWAVTSVAVLSALFPRGLHLLVDCFKFRVCLAGQLSIGVLPGAQITIQGNDAPKMQDALDELSDTLDRFGK